MLPLPDAALDHYSARQSLVMAGAEVSAQMWAEVDPARVVDSWLGLVPELSVVVAGAQLGAARPADRYLDDVAAWQDADPASASPVDPAAFAGVASDGRDLMSLLASPAFSVLQAIASGVMSRRAMSLGGQHLDTIARTQIADAGRVADGVALAAREGLDGYVRVVVGKTCNRCILLAGKKYKWNAGFDRHPRCDCVHLPCKLAEHLDVVQDPAAIYRSMTERERQRAGWSVDDQKALADGADIGQVTNASRGVYSAGGKTFTKQGTTKRSLAGSRLDKGERRLTPEQIYRDAGDNRDEALRQLYRHGYLVNEPALLRRSALDLVASKPGPTTSGAEKRAAARARQREIDRRGRLADLLAELDSLIARKAETAVFRQRISAAAGSVETSVLDKLLRPIESGNTTALRSAMTRAGKAEGLTPVGRAGDKARYNPDVHNPVGDLPAAGTSVVVVRRGTVLNLNGETIPLSKADVSTVGVKPAPKPAPKPKPKPPTVAELRALAKEAGFLIPSGLRKADLITHIQSWEAGTGRRILPEAPVAKPVTKKATQTAKAKAKPKTPLRQATRREVSQIEGRAQVSRLQAELATSPDPQRKAALEWRLEDAKARAAGVGGHYNWESPYFDDVAGHMGDPTAAQLLDHIEARVHSDINGTLRTEMVDELVRQAEVVPRTTMHLHGIGSMSRFDLQENGKALAYFTRAERTIHFHPDWRRDRVEMDAGCRQSLATNWWTRTDAPDHMAGTLAHEFGHHVGERILSLGNHRQVTELAEAIDEALGAGGSISRPVRDGAEFHEIVGDYLKGPDRHRVSKIISTYAVESYHELMAESWHEFTGSRNPRPEIVVIGTAMRRLAEEIELMLT